MSKTRLFLFAAMSFGAAMVVTAQSTVADYLESLRVEDRGWGHFADDDVPHLASTYYVLSAYQAIGVKPPVEMKTLKADTVAIHPLGQPKEALRCRIHAQEMHEFATMEAAVSHLLGVPVRGDVVARSKDWRTGGVSSYSWGYEKGQNPVLVQEVHKLILRNMLNSPIDERCAREFKTYLDARERENGSYNEAPAADGSEGHLVNTCYAVKARKLLDPSWTAKPGLADWVRACQRPDGGFTWCPKPILGDVSDMWYAYAAVELLEVMGASPSDKDALIKWILSCKAPEGGFGDRPGARSMPAPTYWAIDSLKRLGWQGDIDSIPSNPYCRRLACSDLDEASREGASKTDLSSLHCYTVQLEAPGSGSTREAVQIAKEEKIHLWGCKNPEKGWIAAAQAEADRQGVQVTFFDSSEFYGVWATVPGFGTYSHFIDPVRPATVEWPKYDREVADWRVMRDEFFRPNHENGGFALWQISDHECVARILLDESVKNGGYEAIGTFHFGCFEMSWLLPFTLRYIDELPLMTNQDSHGETWWWRENLTAMRNVFLAKEPTYAALREAMKKRLVVSVRKDSHTGGKLRLVGGTESLRAYVKAHEADWSASGEKPDAFSIQVLRPTDVFEVGHPEVKGITIRVRQDRAWRETDWLQPAKYELVEAKLDGKCLWYENRISRFGYHFEQKYKRDMYDVIFIPEGVTSGTVTLRFDPVDPKSGLSVLTRSVEL